MTPLSVVDCKYGAPMGRRDSYPADRDTAINLEIERLLWVDGDYDQGNCYWGGGHNDHIWRFTGEDAESQVEVFIRAKTEAEAVAKLHEQLPAAVVQCDGLEDMLAGYIRAALWSSSGPSDGIGACEMLDDIFGETDISPEAVAAMRRDCSEFLAANRELIGGKYGWAGTDFWLTRNHHGAGFWDGDWPDDVGEKLADAAHAFGGVDLYVGDDGKIYAQ